ncbi:MAG: hypothetical protein HY278_11820, partial [candidate division NC10 bacterium]|nr:hypothetical protein [candidate division NC10 bacterium]
VALFLFAVGLAFVAPAIVSGGIVGRYPLDGTRQFYFIRQYLLDSLAEGRLPLWNPYTYFGQPFLANIQWGVFYPLNLALVPLPRDLAYNLFLGVHLSMAGVFMYLLARHWKLARSSALVASLAYMLSDRFVGYAWGGVLNILSAAAWPPTLLLLFDQALTDYDRRSIWAAVAAGTFGLEILSGHPEYTFFTAFVLLAAAAWATWEGSPRGASLGRLLAPLGLWGAVIGGGAALAAVQLIPTYQAAQLSTRSFTWTLAWPRGVIEGSYNPLRLLTWVSPDLFGNPANLQPAASDWLSYVLQEVHSNEFRGYIGILPLSLAAFSLTRWHTAPRIRFLWALLGVCLLLSLGGFTPLYRLLYAAVPPLRAFRIPARFLSVVVFAGALLAGFGAQTLLQTDRGRARHWAMALGVAAALLLLGTLGGHLLRARWLGLAQQLAGPVFAQRPGGRWLDARQREAMIHRAYAMALRGGLVAAGLTAASACVFLCAKAGEGLRRMLAVGIVGVTALDIGSHAIPYTASERMETHLSQNIALVEVLRKAGAQGRAFVLPPILPEGRPDPVRPSENAFMHYRLFTAAGYDPFELASYRAVISLAEADLRRGSSFVASLLGLRFIVSEVPLMAPDFRSVGRLGQATIYENSRALPRFYIATEARPVTDDVAAAIAAIRATDLVPGRQVLIEGPEAPRSDPGQTAEGQVEVRTLSPERLLFKVSSPEAGFLVAN